MSNYRNQDQILSNAFKALANPNRLAIFRRLLSCCQPGNACPLDDCMKLVVGDLGKDMNIAPSTLSHHLKELHRAGIIAMQRKGQFVECWVETEMVDALTGFLNNRIEE